MIFMPSHPSPPPSAPPLHQVLDIFAAAHSSRVGAVRHFLRAQPGAARVTGFDERSALHHALHHGASHDRAAVCQVLLQAEADVDAKDHFGHLVADACDMLGLTL